MERTLVAGLVLLLGLTGCELGGAAEKIAGCPGACNRLAGDCKSSLSALASLPEIGGPFADPSTCQSRCLVAPTQDASGNDTTWAKAVQCGIAETVAQAASLDAACEAFKVCAYREINAFKLAGCPSACSSMEACAKVAGQQVQIIDGYTFQDKARCEADCNAADWGQTRWDRAAECSAAQILPAASDDCVAFQACVLASGG